jgi:hypothetical protein
MEPDISCKSKVSSDGAELAVFASAKGLRRRCNTTTNVCNADLWELGVGCVLREITQKSLKNEHTLALLFCHPWQLARK